ncbi:phage tail tape measure protein [Sporosarcina saromensis]|uniref:Phage tail tape measure protein n=1 Tax=Sporosarcina saromensis TaxID=359365 RepID=A0ABU4G5A7_9BACL|nr:phage tail tape measure protein [Sporosarcina saromensis]MDW0112153.1 phage tail tape measure protein [Sporosarcina saromensis]
MEMIARLGADISGFTSEMGKVKHEMSGLQDGFKDLGNKLRGLDGKSLKELGGNITNAGKNMTLLSAPLAALGFGAIKIGSDFEQSMANVSAISGATGDDLASLEAKARELGSTTKFSASEASDALSYMAMAGWKTEDMLGGIDGVMNLAAASGEDLALVSDIVTDALTGFGMSASDSGKFADILAAASSNANTNVGMLGESFKYVAPLAGAMGYSAEDTSKALSLMANAGIKGSQAGTSLKSMLSNLASPTKKMQNAMDDLGISLTNSDGSMKTLDEVMLNLRDSFGGLDEQQQAAYASTIFGKEAMAGALSVINASEEDYNKLSDALGNSSGKAEEMADVMGDTVQGRMLEMKSALEEVGIIIFESLKPALEKVIEWVTKLAQWFQNLSPEMQTAIVVIGGIVAAIGPVLVVVGTLVSAIGSIITAFTAGSAIMTAFGAVLAVLTSPVSLIIGAIAALIAIGVLLWKNWDTVSEKAVEVFDFLKEKINSAMNSVKDIIDNVMGFVESIFTSAMKFIFESVGINFSAIEDKVSNVMDGIWNIVDEVWYAIKSTFNTVLEVLKALVTGDFKKMKELISNHLKLIKATVSNIWEEIKLVFSNLIGLIVTFVAKKFTDIKNSITDKITQAKNLASSIIEGLRTAFSNTISTLYNKVKSTFDNIKDAIFKPIERAKDLVKGAVDSILGFFRGLKIPEIKIPKIKLPHFSIQGKFSLSPPSIPKIGVNWYKTGGIIEGSRQGSIIGVGEQGGTEAVLPLSNKSKMKPFAQAVAKMMPDSIKNRESESRGLVIHFNVEKMVANEKTANDFAKTLENELFKKGFVLR